MLSAIRKTLMNRLWDDRRRAIRSIGALTIVIVAVLGAGGNPVAAAPEPAQQPSTDELRQQLAERFAPIVMLKQQDEECSTDGEQYRPGSIDIVLDNPEIALRQVGRSDPVVMRAPGAADLFGLGEGFFLDFPGNSLTPGCIYERDFWKYTGDRPAAIYAHVVQQPDEPDLVFVQYWFYWYYNDWNNKHESDWEGITLKFEASSVEQALQSEPVAVGYSQHEGGERASWDDSKLEREGDRPVVYSSAGSHASYFGSALYLGRAASEGFGCDNTSGPSERVDPEVILLPDSVSDPGDPFAWLAFNGRWGERQEGPFNGPTGPAVKERWLEPAPWFDELRGSSVVIPAGDSQASSIIGVFCNVVERGSKTLVNLTVSPVQVIVSAVILAWLVSFLVKRTDWSVVPLTPIRRRRRAGQIIRAAASTYRRGPLIFVLFGLVYIPAAIVTGALAWLIEFVPLLGSLLTLSGSGSGTNLVVARTGRQRCQPGRVLRRELDGRRLPRQRPARNRRREGIDATGLGPSPRRRRCLSAFLPDRRSAARFVLRHPLGHPSARALPTVCPSRHPRRSERTSGARSQHRTRRRPLVPHRARLDRAERPGRHLGDGRRGPAAGPGQRHPALAVLGPRIARLRDPRAAGSDRLHLALRGRRSRARRRSAR